MSFFKDIKCFFGFHGSDEILIIPEEYRPIYKKIFCNCGSAFRIHQEVLDHFSYVVPVCRFNRVCLHCKHIDDRLDKAIEELLLEDKKSSEHSFEEKYNKALEIYNANKRKKNDI